MRRLPGIFALGLLVGLLLIAQSNRDIKRDANAEALGHGMPDLKTSQVEALLKEDKKKSVEDADEILNHANELRAELDLNDPHVLSLKALKEAEEIEKLAKRIRSRMRRF